MPRDLRRIAAALNAYPWTRGQMSDGHAAAPAHCAVGALLRDAGVSTERLGDTTVVWAELRTVYAPILQHEYGISGFEPLVIGNLNDTSRSRPEAVRRILCALSGVVDPPGLVHRGARPEHGSDLPPAA